MACFIKSVVSWKLHFPINEAYWFQNFGFLMFIQYVLLIFLLPFCVSCVFVAFLNHNWVLLLLPNCNNHKQVKWYLVDGSGRFLYCWIGDSRPYFLEFLPKVGNSESHVMGLCKSNCCGPTSRYLWKEVAVQFCIIMQPYVVTLSKQTPVPQGVVFDNCCTVVKKSLQKHVLRWDQTLRILSSKSTQLAGDHKTLSAWCDSSTNEV